MSEEKKSIFRQKSLDRISSPEELDQYLQVTTPGTWLSMGAVILLLIGIFVWAAFGHLNTSLQVAVAAKDGNVLCYVPIEKAEKLPEHPEVKINQNSYQASATGLAPMMIDGTTDVSMRIAGLLNEGDFVCPLKVETSELADGVYEGEILVETVSPISFILN